MVENNGIKNSKSKTKLEETEEFKSGFTWRSMLALLYSITIFTPAVIWLQLVTLGVGLGGVVSFGTLLLFAELARMSKKPLTTQEAVMIFGPATIAGSAGFINLIYRMWFVKQPLLRVFGINPIDIPRWWAPPPSSLAYEMRTFLSPDVALPFIINLAYWFVNLCSGLFFGLFLREVYIEGERLQFPIQHITVDAITSLTEREETRLTVLAWSMAVGFIYALILYTIPTYSTAAGYPISTIPIPWIDFTLSLQSLFPGIAFGIATDLVVLTHGFVLPTRIVIGMLIGSIARFLIINPLLVNMGLTRWAEEWIPGMDLTKIFQQSTLYFWLSPLIGIGFATGIVPVIWNAKTFMRSIKASFIKPLKYGRISGAPFSPLILISLYIIGCVGALALDIILVPGFPVWLLAIYELLLPFVIGLMSGRMIGLTGQSIDIPHLNNLVILAGIAQGYDKIDAWFLPLSLNPGTGWLKTMKVCQLTRTKISSWVKMNLIAHPIALLMGFIYTTLFWQIAPIPSAIYPAPQITWPIRLMHKCTWISAIRGTEFFNVPMIIYSFLIFGALISITRMIRLPFSMVSVAVGLGSPIPVHVTQVIGLIIGKIIAKFFGEKFFARYKTTISAGVSIGEGIAIVIGVLSALIIKSIWARPF